MIDPAALLIVLCALTGWLDRRERQAIAYLVEENRLLRRQLGPRRLRLTDDDRRRLAARAHRVGRAALQGLPRSRHPIRCCDVGPDVGVRRASRGGAWRHVYTMCRVTLRSKLAPSFRYNDYGFRVAQSL